MQIKFTDKTEAGSLNVIKALFTCISFSGLYISSRMEKCNE